MKTIYFDCSTGAAGDMIMAALYELTDEKDAFIRRMNALGIPGVRVAAQKSERYGVTGTHICVTVDGREEDDHSCGHEHAHDHGHGAHTHSHHHGAGNSLADIEGLVSSLGLPDQVGENALAIYKIIADAESRVHGEPVEEIHFHEVGAMDAVADIVGVCLLMEALAPEKILASEVHVGSGHVHCAHGVLPVPAPATALILAGVPMGSGSIRGELCTPTGAAMIRHFAEGYGGMNHMRSEKIGYGFGTRDFGALSCVRAFLGEA